MEKNNNCKRGRELGEEDDHDDSSGKKQHQDASESSSSSSSSSDNHKYFGVFDFPWLKESLIFSKSQDDCVFEDSFSISLLHDSSSAFEFCLPQTPQSCIDLHQPLEKLEESLWTLEVDCDTWPELLAQHNQ